ncbi:flippase [Halorubrum sodomense]|uniref:Membrane protein involved in the export of O-antigen and teichoic acid n=1 Tax=Halorubrum sodomense TaxID=35743 RepID=A0A1I6FX88_HALSD|nr:flippase [Halorubrum sodomense]SFR34565.1 Membrane protein involved in the export of O-antigen and teichoic acid [Halorubrum sodomense]
MGDENDDGASTLATQGGIGLAGNVVGKLLGFLFVAVATRLTSSSEYGTFVLGLSIVIFVQGFASLSIHRSLDYFVPKYLTELNYGQAKRTLQNAFVIGIVSSMIGAILLVISRGYIESVFEEPQLGFVLLIFCLLIPIQTINDILLTTFNSVKEIKYRVLMKNIINPITRTISIIILLYWGAGIIGLVGGHLIGISVTILFGITFFLYELDWFRETTAQPISNRALISYSLPLVLAGVIYSIVGQIDFFVIGYYLTSSKVGQYQVAYLLGSNLLIVLTAITPIFKPMIAEASSDTATIRRRFQLATRWVTMLSLPIAITLALAPEAYLSIFFTNEYTAANTALIALVIGYMLNAFSGPEGMVLEGLGFTRLTLFNSILLVVINVILDIILVPRMGILGAGIGTASALTVAGFAGIIEIYFFKNIHPYTSQLFRTYLAAVIPILLGWSLASKLDSEILIAVALPIVVVISYVYMLTLTGAFSSDDKQIAHKIDDKMGYPVFSKIIHLN